MKDNSNPHLDDLADRFASARDLPLKDARKPKATASDRKNAIYLVGIVGALLLFLAVAFVILFVRR